MASNDASTAANRSTMTPERLVVIFTLFLAIVLVLFLKHVLAPVWVAVGLPDRPLIEGAEEWTYSSLVAIAITAGLIGGAWASPRIRQLAFETASELTMGMTVADWWGVTGREKNVTYLRDVDHEQFFRLLVERIGRL